MLRFAQNPTGDMHLGNLRIALFNYILSVQRDEPLLIRIEDTDQKHNISSKEKEIFEILSLFGIKHQEELLQSNNLRFHRAMALQLLQDKKAFNCFCRSETLDAKREAAEEAKLPYRYDGTCENLSDEETLDNPNSFTIRLKKTLHPITITDIVKGENTFSPEDIDSFILLEANKHPTYNFACAVDDMLADVSLIIREENHFSDTPKQIAIHEALGYTKKIEYAHLPLILNDQGNTISEHDDETNIKWLLEEGYLPEAISNYLIAMGNTTPTEIFGLKEAIKWFDLKTISKAPVHFELEKLKFINREHLKGLDPKELSRYVGFADSDIGNLAKVFLEEAGTLKELRTKIKAIFAPKEVPLEYKETVEKLRILTIQAPHFDDFNAYTNYLMHQSTLSGENFFIPLRILLTGAEYGPELANLYPYLKNYIKEVVK
ncbi:MAG: glutamate--tRNA ligase [Sulfuricurvum sp.]